jgi:P2-related tail formation protein
VSVTYDDFGVDYDDSNTLYDSSPTVPVPASCDDALRLWESTGPISTWDTDAGWPLLRWLSGPGTILQVLDDLCRDTPDDPGWSVLLDVDRCPTFALPWLGQFVGVRLAASLPDAEMRQAIRDEQGFSRGTLTALQQAAKPYLKPGASITIVERTTDAYHFTVEVNSSDLLGLTYAELSALYPTYAALEAAFATYGDYSSSIDQLAAALRAAKPAGLVMTVTPVGSSVTVVDDHDGTETISGATVTDNHDGTLTITGASVVDDLDGTETIS